MTRTLLIGREAELADARALLDGGARLVVLRGPPGVGKSTLARALRAQLRAAGRAVVSVALDAQRDRAAVLAALAAALDRPARTTDDRVVLDRVARTLDDAGAVLLLDGLDAAADTAALVLRDLFEATEHVAVVACAWRRLGLPDEHVLAVGPLAPHAAAELLTRRVAQLAPTRRVGSDEALALVARVGSPPLAVELVAARVASLGPDAVLRSLDARGLVSDALDRALDAAWRLLRDDDRRALAALAALRGRFDAVTAATMIDGPDPLDALERLAAASMVECDEGSDGVLFSLLDSVRDHAARQPTPSRDDLDARHARAFACAAATPADDPRAWVRLARDRDDLLAAWSWSIARAPDLAVRLAVHLDPLLIAQGPVALHRRVLVETLGAHVGDGADLAARVDLCLALGRIDAIRGRARASLAPWGEALTLATRLGDRGRVGWSSAYLSISLRLVGRLDEARALGLQALSIATTAGDRRLLAIAEHALACVHYAGGDATAAGDGWRRALAATRVAGAPRLEGIMLANLARLAYDAGDYTAAAGCCAEARAALALRDDRFHLARIEMLDGLVDARAGRHDDAERRLAQSLDVAVEHDDLDGELEAREALAEAALLRADQALAARRVELFAAAARVSDDAAWGPRVARLQAGVRDDAPPRAPALRLARDGRAMTLGDARVDLARRGPLRRVLRALVEARLANDGRALSTADVLAAGWPGEKMLPESGAARVYMAVRRLRALGLEALLTTSDDGYALDPRADVAWLDDP